MNEHSAGCAPAVLEALHAIPREEVARYPDYGQATAACAARFGVEPDWVLLTNGLDDGLHAVAHRARTFRTPPSSGRFEALIIEPAFEMFAAAAHAADAEIVRVVMAPDFEFPLDRAVAAVTPRTRLVFVNDPNNPTGGRVAADAIEHLAAAAPDALVLVDEAYADFSGRTIIGPLLDRHRHLVVGRTFAKAHGLAGLRIGALVAHPETLDPIRRRQPPYAVNAMAAHALVAALRAPDYTAWSVAQAGEAKRLVYGWCEARGLEHWPSEANFVLVRFGPAVSALAKSLEARGVLVRDKSATPGCAGCLRLSTAVVTATETCLAALDECWAPPGPPGRVS